jgi:hypothetical protein
MRYKPPRDTLAIRQHPCGKQICQVQVAKAGVPAEQLEHALLECIGKLSLPRAFSEGSPQLVHNPVWVGMLGGGGSLDYTVPIVQGF